MRQLEWNSTRKQLKSKVVSEVIQRWSSCYPAWKQLFSSIKAADLITAEKLLLSSIEAADPTKTWKQLRPNMASL